MSNGNNEHMRFEYIDALRGIAAVSVCFHHLFGYIYGLGMMGQEANQILRESILESFDFGRFGVVLFFLISGFIIPSSLKPGVTIKRFAITRVFRLYPAFWFACTLIFVASPLFFDRTIPLHHFLANLTMMPKIFHSPELSGAFWTLFIEIIFYFGCALLFYACQLENALVVGAIAFLLHIITPLEVFLNHQFQLNLTIRFIFFHLSFLFIGSVFRLAIINKSQQARTVAFSLTLITLLTVPLMTGQFFSVPAVTASDFVMHGAKATTLSYYLAFIIFLLVTITKFGFNSLTVDMGKISYSMYLLHMLIFMAVAKVIPPQSLVDGTAYCIISMLMTYVAAKLSFKFIEVPSVEFGRSLVMISKSKTG